MLEDQRTTVELLEAIGILAARIERIEEVLIAQHVPLGTYIVHFGPQPLLDEMLRELETGGLSNRLVDRIRAMEIPRVSKVI